MVTYCCVYEAVASTELKKCFYGAGLAFVAAIAYFVVPLLAGTTISIITVGIAVLLLAVVYCPDCSRLWHISWRLWQKLDTEAV